MKNKNEDELKRFLEFLSEKNPKSAEEIEKEFGKVKMRKLFQIARASGYETKRSHAKKMYLREKRPFDIQVALKERDFTSHEAYDKDGKFFIPGRLIVFPQKNWEKIRIVPMADIFFGDPLCNMGKLKQYVEWIRRDEHVFTCLIGNIFSGKIPLVDAEVTMRRKELEKILSPIFPKILFTVSGPNERKYRESKRVNFDPLASLFDGKISHFLDQAHIILKFEGQEKIMKLFAIHGESNAIVTGAKINPIYNMLAFADADVMLMGNLKYSHIEKPQVISFRPDGKGLDIQKVYLVLLPSFKSYWGSREAAKGYPAQFEGQINIAFYRSSGDIHVYSGMLKKEEEVI